MAADTKPRFNRRQNQPPAEDPSGKLQPQALELEESVLGALMLEKDAYTEVCDILVPDSFYEPKHQKIFDAISQLGNNQRPIDMLTVTEQLRNNGTLEEVGGALFISELTAHVSSAAHVEFHARIIAQKYLARRLIAFSSDVQNKAFDQANDIDDILQEAEGSLFEISQTQLKREVAQIDPIISQAVKQIQAAAFNENGLSGLETGFTDLDNLTSGWQNSDLIIIAARPAMGKTAFVLSMAKNIAIDFQQPVGIFSLEMANVQLINRIISNVCEIPGEKIKSGNLDEREWDQLNSRINYMYGAPLYIDETPGLSITELRTKARRLVREKGVKLIIIDYLQLMTAAGMKLGSREQEVSTISRSLKALAKELNIPIIALSQLNRSTEAREDKRPVLSDLRESGAIEQDADFVAFIHRPEYYTRSSEDGERNDIRGLAEFIVAKHRSGQVGTVKMRFKNSFVRFENWDSGRSVRQLVTVESKINNNSEPTASGGAFSLGPTAPDTMPDIMPDANDDTLPY